ncbi:hypothetical protein AVEN_194756-1 [Araneus ventricosus]|uniref:Uncharacterized protein n=1 Tax=Araneus ventricosus TaxID=182803 RepID=A0A4Y2B360_ARAVE|nr:hypothetical protein AVEN_194756-1 [Araneus ventricosus]
MTSAPLQTQILDSPLELRIKIFMCHSQYSRYSASDLLSYLELICSSRLPIICYHGCPDSQIKLSSTALQVFDALCKPNMTKISFLKFRFFTAETDYSVPTSQSGLVLGDTFGMQL